MYAANTKKFIALVLSFSIGLSLYFFGFLPSAEAAIAFDAATGSTAVTTTTLTFSHTANTSSSRVTVIFVAIAAGADTVTSTVSYGGVNLTQRTNLTNGIQEQITVFSATNTPSGANNVVVNLGLSKTFRAVAVSIAGTSGIIDATSTINAGTVSAGAAYGDGATTTVTSTIVFSAGHLGNSTGADSLTSPVAADAMTVANNDDINGGNSFGVAYKELTASSSATYRWRNDDSFVRRAVWSLIAFRQGSYVADDVKRLIMIIISQLKFKPEDLVHV